MKILENLNELVGKTIESITHDGVDGVTIQTTDGCDYDIVAYNKVDDGSNTSHFGALEFTKLNEEKKLNLNSIDDLVEFFESNGFNVNLFEEDGKQCAELEMWTDGGVNMLIYLTPFTKEDFISYVMNDFDTDEEIELHREDGDYRRKFTIRESLDDFTKYHEHLKSLVEKIENN